MKRVLMAFTLAVFGFTAPVNAFEINDMTDKERITFRAEIRAYLMDNPEVLLEAIQVLEDRQATDQVSNDAALLVANADEIYNDGASWVGGNPDGDITLVEFSDYRCPYCKKAHPDVNELIKSDGNIRIIYKEYPILGQDSLTTSQFALATLLTIDADTYKLVNNALMELRGSPTTENLTGIAEKIGFDPAPVFAKMSSDEVGDIIKNNRSLGQRMQVSGTPTFIIGNQIIRGYIPLAAMREVVKEERSK